MFSLCTCSGSSACDRILTHLWPCMVFSSEAETRSLTCVGVRDTSTAWVIIPTYLAAVPYLSNCLFVLHTASHAVHVYWLVEVVTGSLGLTMLTLT